jgi:hypothetical protein
MEQDVRNVLVVRVAPEGDARGVLVVDDAWVEDAARTVAAAAPDVAVADVARNVQAVCAQCVVHVELEQDV